MQALTIHEAAETTGWSARMLRYIERSGLVAPARSASGYRLYGPAELQRLRREPSVLVTRTAQPLLWLLVFGAALSRARNLTTGGVTDGNDEDDDEAHRAQHRPATQAGQPFIGSRMARGHEISLMDDG